MIKRSIHTIAAAAVTATLALPGLAHADAATERGLTIAREVDRRDKGWKDTAAEMTMTLSDRRGRESTRSLRQYAFEVEAPGKSDRGVVVFDSPRDIEGTALLSHTRIRDPDDQWLFLPALERVKRISSANKSGPFVGSEFAYEDLLSQDVRRYTYRYVRDEVVDGQGAFVVESYPVYDNSGYTKLVTWVDKTHYRILKVDFYDRKGSRLKTLAASGYAQYLDKYWRPQRLTMINHQSGKKTVLDIARWDFRTGRDESFFTPSRLKRIR